MTSGEMAILMMVAITLGFLIYGLKRVFREIVRVDDGTERMEDTLERVKDSLSSIHRDMRKDEGYESRLEQDRLRQDAVRNIGLSGYGLGRGPGIG